MNRLAHLAGWLYGVCERRLAKKHAATFRGFYISLAGQYEGNAIMQGDVHTVPINDLVDHEETRDCWCGPRLLQRCPECDGSGIDCWRCIKGMVRIFDPLRSVHVIHNAIDGRP